MKVFTYDNINDCYTAVVDHLLEHGDAVGNTLECDNVVLQIVHPTLTNLTFPKRRVSEKYANGELGWYWSGDNSCKTIGSFARKWLDISDDGETSNSAYGYILFKKYKNQLEEVIRLLKKDPITRRAVLNISDPCIDRINTKDMQCTIAIQFMIRNGLLNTTVYMRSNDVAFGLPYDYIFFMSLATYVAKRLDINIGSYIHHATSMHLYNTDIIRIADIEQSIDIDVEKYFTIYETEVLNEKQ